MSFSSGGVDSAGTDFAPVTGAEPEAGPGGRCGASYESSAVNLPPPVDASDQPRPGPAELTLRRAPMPRKDRPRKEISKPSPDHRRSRGDPRREQVAHIAALVIGLADAGL